jgi:hypothetical protein
LKNPSFLVLLALVIFATSAIAQKRGPSTPEERQEVVQLTHMLETDPLSDQAVKARRWLIPFLADVPDISVTICMAPLDPVLKSKKNYSAEIVTQMMFGQAAFVIEHPDKATDDRAVYTAGVESSLKLYESILKAKPKAKWPYLDDLVTTRQTEQWPAVVQSLVAKCGQK